jgi:hypothetical protein
LRETRCIARLALIAAVLLALVFTGEAAAQYGPFPPQSEDYGPGISVTGVGYAPLGKRDRATARGVSEARDQAEAIASKLGVSVGQARVVEADTPFDPRPPCRNSTRRRCAPLEAVVVEVTFDIVGGPSSDEGAREVSGTGTGVAETQNARETSPSIRRALRAARLAAAPIAAENGRANAQAAATGAGVTLGPLFSVVELNQLQYGYGFGPSVGVFGPGQYCGFIRRTRLRRDPETGERHVVRLPRKRRCFVPRRVTSRLEVTYLGS